VAYKDRKKQIEHVVENVDGLTTGGKKIMETIDGFEGTLSGVRSPKWTQLETVLGFREQFYLQFILNIVYSGTAIHTPKKLTLARLLVFGSRAAVAAFCLTLVATSQLIR